MPPGIRWMPIWARILIRIYIEWKVSKFQLRSSRRKKINKNYFLHITHPQSLFQSCFKLALNSMIDLLDFIVFGNWFQISVTQKCAEFISWVDDLAGERKSIAPFLRIYGTSLSLSKRHINLVLKATVLL